MQTPAVAERRNSQRFKVGDGIFAHVASGSQAIGRVLNVSEGGLAMEYVDDEGFGTGSGTLLHLFGPGGKFYLADVPFKTVSSFEVPMQVAFSTVAVRRMGMSFEGLTQAQKCGLNDLIRKSNTN